MTTKHKIIIGNATNMAEIPDESVHLMVTSPPYFNAPFDYKGLFKSYDQYLEILKQVAVEVYRVIQIWKSCRFELRSLSLWLMNFFVKIT